MGHGQRGHSLLVICYLLLEKRLTTNYELLTMPNSQFPIPNSQFPIPYKYLCNSKPIFSLVAGGTLSSGVRIAYFKAECASDIGGFSVNLRTVS
jgi:hypothetical protein